MEEIDDEEAKKFARRKKNSEPPKKPWAENVKMEKEMNDMNQKSKTEEKLEDPKKLITEQKENSDFQSNTFAHRVQTRVLELAFCTPCQS